MTHRDREEYNTKRREIKQAVKKAKRELDLKKNQMKDERSIRYVSNALGFSRSSVHRAYNRYRETNSFNRRSGSGRKRSTTVRDDRLVQMSALRNRHLTAVSYRNELRRVRQVNVSPSTIRRRLYEANLSAKRPLKGPKLLPHHRRARLEFARNRIDWTEEDVVHVWFTDESKFNLRFSDGRLCVRRRKNERYAACTFSPRVPFGDKEILVWG
ncbi:hypothetical protein ILUMI_11854 [Ignelater luminosus]|uniref:Transposase Tc1-like domain-containing protein n=1 Tax=Ignelater luminosus TaxID=2038154 RepID=A0A8K0CXN0_IGNLU|nr:hypothetical protein ILUMI_11854 [Ignelater luminosus]